MRDHLDFFEKDPHPFWEIKKLEYLSMADIKTLIIRLYQSISNCADQSSRATMQ